MRCNFQKYQQSGNLTNLCLVFALLLFVTACVCSTGRDDTSKSKNETPTPKPVKSVEKDEKDSSKNKDNGDFKVEYSDISNSKYAELHEKIKNEKLLENAATDLNKALSLPEDIIITSKDCGEANAQFDPNTQTVTICYELMAHFYEIFRKDGMGEKKADEKMNDAIRFVFLHEVGHALIYNYKLPIMGNEEDAADRCSSYINITELGDKGVKAVLAAADAFKIESKDSSPTKRSMADEHLLQEQRHYNSLCMIYGSNPSKYSYFVEDDYLPEARADRCPQEYKKTVDSWKSLLAPWRKSK